MFGMKELIVETSGDEGLVAVIEDGKLLGEERLPGGPELSKMLGLMVKKLILKHGTNFDRIVVGTGPGSFTGIRVGRAMAESLSMGWDVPLVTVCSLLGYEGTVVIDARSSGFYVQKPGEEVQLVPVERAEPLLRGNVVSPHPEKIRQRLPSVHPTKVFLSPLLLAQNTSIPYNETSV
jgi:tRNA threonylcarbamoyl adenosine modification protein YeaZ